MMMSSWIWLIAVSPGKRSGGVQGEGNVSGCGRGGPWDLEQSGGATLHYEVGGGGM